MMDSAKQKRLQKEYSDKIFKTYLKKRGKTVSG